MSDKVNWSNLIRSRPVKVIPTAVLALFGVIGNPDRKWVLFLALACFCATVLFEFNSYQWERNKSDRLGDSYKKILGRVLNLIADLSELTAGRFDLWAVDLYLPQRRPLFARPRASQLELTLHVALTDVRAVPNQIGSDHRFFGRCFDERRPELWWDATLAPSSPENRWESLEGDNNEELQSEYGVISANPVVDEVRGDCRGLLVIHAMRDAEVATMVLGALTQSKGKRRIAAACLDIYNYLQTS